MVTADPSAGLPSADWRTETGDEPYWLAEHGRAADLIVIGRPHDGEAVAMDMLEAALLGSGRPVLIAPKDARRELSGVVVIAWKDRAEAARAIAAAQPFVQLANKVVILSVSEDAASDGPVARATPSRIVVANPAVSVQCVKPHGRPPVEALLASAAHAVNADMLVMGGYGHSQPGEIIFAQLHPSHPIARRSAGVDGTLTDLPTTLGKHDQVRRVGLVLGLEPDLHLTRDEVDDLASYILSPRSG